MFLKSFTPLHELENFLLPSGAGRRADAGASALFGAPYDIYRHEDRIEVWIDLPGLDASAINLTVSGRSLEISGRRERRGPGEGTAIASHRRFGDFKYHLQIGGELDPSRVSADYVDGVLKVTLPLAEQAKPRRIAVGSAVGGELEDPR